MPFFNSLNPPPPDLPPEEPEKDPNAEEEQEAGTRSIDPKAVQAALELEGDSNSNRVLEQIKNLLTLRMLSQSEEEEDRDVHPLVWVALALIVIIGGYFLLRPFFTTKRVDPAYTKVEAIKRIKQLRLVKHHYETIIPISRPGDGDGKLEFLLVAPAEVSGYVNLSKLKFTLTEDSLVLVRLPEPEISQTRISLKQTKEYTFQRSFLQRLGEKLNSKVNYLVIYDQIRKAVDSARLDVRRRAEINGILDDTRDKAEDYIRNMVNNLGFRVEFIEPIQEGSEPDSLQILYRNLQNAPDTEEKSRWEKEIQKFIQKGGKLIPSL